MVSLVIDDSALRHADPVAALPAAEVMETAPPLPSGPAPMVLRVSGGKPLRMEAVLLVEGEEVAAAAGGSRALRIYRRAGGDIVVALRTPDAGCGVDAAVDRVEVFPDLEEAARWLEGFDPTADLATELDASDRGLTAVELALRAAALRIRSDAAARRYRGLVGDVLYRLEQAG